MWAYDFKKNWYEVDDFLAKHCDENVGLDRMQAINALGYGHDANIYFILDEKLEGPLTVYQQKENDELPPYLVKFKPSKSYVEYFVCENAPSVIELMNKLTPLIQTLIMCDESINRANQRLL
ncbi:hypothetical protein EC844_10758 [Acinetobacter calcoaceticus]|uniref:Uncharacterized protein n=1 Tax=Acinetobacter calcoaceticus TaxID=471 RepID=A0A4R1XTJ4_ACICA|nr:hypothetical protein EC844_10758 [Acinetobacter calcoaceticus]